MVKKKAEGKSPGRLTKKFIKQLCQKADALRDNVHEAGDEFFDSLEVFEAGDDTPLTEEMIDDLRIRFGELVDDMMGTFAKFVEEELEYTRLGMVKDRGAW